MEKQDFYDINIQLDNMHFTCAPIWNPDTHTYDSRISSENNIRVENRSVSANPVLITLRFMPLGGAELTAVFYPEIQNEVYAGLNVFSFVLPSGTDNRLSIALTLEGNLPVGTESIQVGKLMADVVPLTDNGEIENREA